MIFLKGVVMCFNGIEKDKTLQNRQKEMALRAFFDGIDKLEL